MFTPEECEHAVKTAEKANVWTKRRHALYPTHDFSVNDVPELANVTRAVDTRVIPLLRRAFNIRDDLEVLVDDLFLIRYSAAGQKSLELHADATTLSFSIALSDPKSYTGGGIAFDMLDAPLLVDQGTAIMHPSKLLHRGADVHTGTRYVLVGFVSVGEDNFLTFGMSPPGSPELLHGAWATCVQLAQIDEDRWLSSVTGEPLRTTLHVDHCGGKWENVARQLTIKANALRQGIISVFSGEEMSDDAFQLLVLNGMILLGSIVFLKVVS